MEYNISKENELISSKLLDIYVTDKILGFDGSFESIKLDGDEGIRYIYRSEALECYLEEAKTFFQNLGDNEIADDTKAFVKNLFEDHLHWFVILLQKILKTAPESNYDLHLLQQFTGNYFGKYLPKDYILSRIIFKFNNDKILEKYSFFQPFLKSQNDESEDLEFDRDIFKTKEAFQIFEDFVAGYISNEYKDFGFIFQRLKYDKLIWYMPHLDFAKWLYHNGYIKEKIYNLIDEKKVFEALDKLSSAVRLHAYVKIKEKYLK